MPWLRVWALPVLPVSWSLEHWMELSPSWVDEESWLRSALSPSCSPSCVTWAMAGIAATASTARSAASNINFFNLPTSLSSRGTVFIEAGPCAQGAASYERAIAQLLRPRWPRLAASRCGLVDHLVARRRVRGAHVERGANLVELEVVRDGLVLDEVDHVLRVTGVAGTLDARTLVRVVALASDREVLVNIGALAFLLFLLGNLSYSR